MGKLVDEEDVESVIRYGSGMVEALKGDRREFAFENYGVAGIDVVCLTTDDKPVALILPNGLDSIERLVRAAVQSVVDAQPQVREVEGRVTRRSTPSDEWKP